MLTASLSAKTRQAEPQKAAFGLEEVCVQLCMSQAAAGVGGRWQWQWRWWAGGPCGLLTVKGDPDLRVVVPVGDLPDIKGLGGRVGQQAEEQDDGVGRGKTFRVDLPGKRQEHSVHGRESQLVYRPGRGRLQTRVRAPELPAEPAETSPVLKPFPLSGSLVCVQFLSAKCYFIFC